MVNLMFDKDLDVLTLLETTERNRGVDQELFI